MADLLSSGEEGVIESLRAEIAKVELASDKEFWTRLFLPRSEAFLGLEAFLARLSLSSWTRLA